VDSDGAFGRRLAQILEVSPEFRLCGSVPDMAAAQAIVAVESPELVLADCDRHSPAELASLLQFQTASAPLSVLAITRHCPAERAEQIFQAGLSGLLLKTEPAEEIRNALRTVLRGQVYASWSVAMPLLKRLLSKPSAPACTGMDSLTDRELRVFELFGFGLSKREVAARLGLSCKTIESHRTKIEHRLGVEGATALAQYAFTWVQRCLRAGCPPGNGTSRGVRS
jgi:DNA-binding NarL/FixJ family response regulator